MAMHPHAVLSEIGASRASALPALLTGLSTLIATGVTIWCVINGQFEFFPNLFYIPIIISCAYFTWRGFVYSAILACAYFFFIVMMASETVIELQALGRTGVFILIAGIIARFSSARVSHQKRLTELLHTHMVLTRVSHRFIGASSDELGAIIDESLSLIAQCLSTVVRVCIVSDRGQEGNVSVLHEWHSADSAPFTDLRPWPLPGKGPTHTMDDDEKLFGEMSENSPGGDEFRLLWKSPHIAPFQAIRIETGEDHQLAMVIEFNTEDTLRKSAELSTLSTLADIISNAMLRVSALNRLRESDERVRRLFMAAHTGLIIHDKGVIIEANPSVTEMTGHDWRDLIGNNGIDLIAPEWRVLVMSKIREESEEAYEAECLRKDGARMWVQFQGRSYFHRGRTLRLTEMRDISLRKKFEDSLKISHERLSRTEKIAHIGSWEMDIASGKANWSDEFFRICGYEPGALIPSAENGFAIIHPDDREKAARAVRDSIESGRPYDIEKRIVRPDGTTVWVHSCGEVIYGKDGTPVKLVGSFLDINARKHAEDELARNIKLLDSVRKAQTFFINEGDPDETFHALLDILTDASGSMFGFLDEVLRDPDGVPFKRSLAISDISWDWESRHLYDKLISRNREFRALKNLAGLPALTGLLVISNSPGDDPRSGGLPPGHPPIKSFMGIPMFARGDLVGVAGVANRTGGYTENDAVFLEPLINACASIMLAVRSKKRERENTLALQNSLFEKEVMLREIHHRVKNNIQIIISLLNLQARRSCHEPSIAVLKDSTARIRAMALVHEKLYRSDSLSRVNFHEYLRSITTELSQSYGNPEHPVDIEIHAGNVYFPIDQAIPCGLIINELITNSFKYAFWGRECGDNKISISIVTHENNRFEITIRDNGVGVPVAAFESQSESLGLTIAKLLADQLGGELHIYTQEGTTAVLSFILHNGEYRK